jgi:DNA-binding response OmpR family regulator
MTATIRPARVLVVEDDRTTADLVALYLRHAGHRVQVEHQGGGALDRLDREAFDLLVLDVMLPGAGGLEICRLVRRREREGRGSPGVVMLTARATEEERVAGLENGADDYVTKPFSPRELVARVQAVLRRRPPGDPAVLTRGRLVIDPERRRVTRDGAAVDLTPSEFAILELLARRPGHVRSRSRLLDALPGDRRETLERTVDVHVRNLRRKLEPDPERPRYIRTVTGVGYAFDAGTPA